MHKLLSTMLVLHLLCVMCTWQTASADSSLVQYPVNGHYYQRFDAKRSWSDAQTYCTSLGAHLATLTSQGENDYVFQNVGLVGVNIWLGGTDAGSQGNWHWVTGEPWSYTNWAPGQPDNASPGQDQLIFWDQAPGKWDDNGLPRNDFPTAQFICEWDQQPPTPTAKSVPTMGEWGMIIFISLAGLGSIYYLRGQRSS